MDGLYGGSRVTSWRLVLLELLEMGGLVDKSAIRWLVCDEYHGLDKEQ